MASIAEEQPVFQFGVFELNSRTGELRKHGIKLKLQDQPLQILTLLLEHAGEVVTRSDIQKRLWPENTYVDFDNAINSAIRKLRDALGDSPENPRFVETLARRGYRFITPVVRPSVHSRHEEAQSSARPARAANKKLPLWWIACAFIFVLVLLGIALRWRLALTHGGPDTPLPAVPLTGNRGYEAFPTLSPEGARVAYSWEETEKQKPNIYVKLIGQGDPIQLTSSTEGDYAPAWSPDGRSIAFLRRRGASHAAIIIIPSIGGQERELSNIAFDTGQIFRYRRSYEISPPFLAWSPDGRWLLSLEKKPSHAAASIVRISIETGSKRTLTFPSIRTFGDGSLAVSPNGKLLAFTRTIGLFERDIYIVSLSEDMLPHGEPKRLTFDNKEIDGLAWTPDGHSLVFSSKRSGRRELWKMPAQAAGQPVRLNAAGDDPRNPAVAREGRHLVYSHSVGNAHTWRMALQGEHRGQTQILISSTRLDGLAKYSPDGQRIAFESNRSGYDEIWTSQADGSHLVQLTAFRAWAGSPRWSPDAQKIAFDSNVAGNWDIYVIGAHGGQPVRLTRSDSNEYRPSWSQDGKWIYYCSTRTQPRQIWKIPATGGAEVQVTKHGGYVAFESVDGKDLYYNNEQGLWKMPVQGGDETMVLPSLIDAEFAPTKNGLYFVDGSAFSDSTPHLRFLNFSTHAIETVATVPGPARAEISVSSDEQWMLFNKLDNEASELMLIENFR